MQQSSISQQMDYLRLPRFMLLFCVRVIIAKRFDDKKMFLFVVDMFVCSNANCENLMIFYYGLLSSLNHHLSNMIKFDMFEKQCLCT